MIATCSPALTAEPYFLNRNSFFPGPIEVNMQTENGERYVIVDVRAEKDFRNGHVPGAISLPEDQWKTLTGLSREVPNLFYCYAPTCHLASRAAQFFARHGFPVMKMEGGFQAWREYDLPIEII